ncbi:hypothetical protein DFR70_12641 [Nocardia tenerifensis]|uniref:Uncharacterized protein n=1 Tax=Nocardia tenerifensis TaxID=228006 RepID=A0A318JSD0_9NOCA|nr:hypothetical protein [Nocardia tenerifensis]PXX53920.1 hypothetical protein DFR70_12641 [Nocardia tenerifensis]
MTTPTLLERQRLEHELLAGELRRRGEVKPVNITDVLVIGLLLAYVTTCVVALRDGDSSIASLPYDLLILIFLALVMGLTQHAGITNQSWIRWGCALAMALTVVGSLRKLYLARVSR